MNCPKCASTQTRVINSRGKGSKGSAERLTQANQAMLASFDWINRQRVCSACTHRWTTIELSITDIQRLSREAPPRTPSGV
jgi:transcriptional regulator NrdR family protein